MSERWSVRVADNGLGLCEVGAFKAQMFNLAQKCSLELPMLKFSTSAPILQNP